MGYPTEIKDPLVRSIFGSVSTENNEIDFQTAQRIVTAHVGHNKERNPNPLIKDLEGATNPITGKISGDIAVAMAQSYVNRGFV